MPRTYTIDGSLQGVKIGEVIMRMHQTQDRVSDAVAAENELVRVHPAALLGCKCGDGKCDPKNCDEVYAMTKDGTRFATFHGLGLQGRKLADGSTSIFRLLSGTKDTLPHCRRLAGMNERNRQFWAVTE